MSTSERRDGGIHLSRRQLLATGAAGGLSLAALGPGSSIAFGATTPKRGGTLQVGLVGGSAATEQLDPNTSTVSSLDLARHQNVFSKLADFDANGKVFPQLAASFEPNKNATSWTVKLKQGVTWHDGSPLTADDVVYSLQRVLDPANKLDSASGEPDDGRPHQDREGRRDDAHDRPQAAVVGSTDAARPALPRDRQERHQDVHGRHARRHRPVQARRLDGRHADDAQGQPELLRVGQAVPRHRRRSTASTTRPPASTRCCRARCRRSSSSIRPRSRCSRPPPRPRR